jgi:hypothetical protein
MSSLKRSPFFTASLHIHFPIDFSFQSRVLFFITIVLIMFYSFPYWSTE